MWDFDATAGKRGEGAPSSRLGRPDLRGKGTGQKVGPSIALAWGARRPFLKRSPALSTAPPFPVDEISSTRKESGPLADAARDGRPSLPASSPTMCSAPQPAQVASFAAVRPHPTGIT